MEDDDDDLMSSLLTKLSNVTVSSPEELIQKFADVLKISRENAAFYLSAASGNLEVAINLWLDDGGRPMAMGRGGSGGGTAAAGGGALAPLGAMDLPYFSGSGDDSEDDMGAGGDASAAPGGGAVMRSLMFGSGTDVRDPDLYAALQAGQIDRATYDELVAAMHPPSAGFFSSSSSAAAATSSSGLLASAAGQPPQRPSMWAPGAWAGGAPLFPGLAAAAVASAAPSSSPAGALVAAGSGPATGGGNPFSAAAPPTGGGAGTGATGGAPAPGGGGGGGMDME